MVYMYIKKAGRGVKKASAQITPLPIDFINCINLQRLDMEDCGYKFRGRDSVRALRIG